MEAAGHQGFDPILGGRSPERSDAGIPTGAEFDVRRQAGVNEALCVGNRPFIEPGNASCERIHERVELGVWQGAINIAVVLGLVSPDILRAQKYFKGAISADELRQSGHRTAA